MHTKILKKIILLLFLCLSTLLVYPQSFNGSVIAGINTSQVSGDELSGFNKAGVIIGGGVSIPLSQKFDAGIEIVFIQKGSRKKADLDKGDYETYKMALSYAEVPIIFEYKASGKLRLLAGPTFGVLVSSKEERYDLVSSLPFEKYEIGIAGGLSFAFVKNLSLQMRLTNSVLPIRKIGANTKYFVSGQYNSGLSFTLKYTFNKSKTPGNDG